MGKTRFFRYTIRILDSQTHTTTPAEPPAAQKTPRVLLAWNAASRIDHARSPQWYVIAGVLVLAAAIYGIVAGAWTVTLIALLLGTAYFLVRNQPMPLKTIEIGTDGVTLNGNFTPWSRCRDFWLIATPLGTELHIARTGALQSEIRLQTGGIDPLEIRSSLSQFLPFRPDQREHLLDALIRLTKL